jgi:predicted nucleic acid-binding protein
MSGCFVDTSVAIALVLARHDAHRSVTERVADRAVRLPAHAQLEAYSVLTRLPGDARLTQRDASALLQDRFGAPAALSVESTTMLVPRLAECGVSGGAVYDAVIAATADEWGAVLLTRDRRAMATYRALSVDHEVIAG